MAPIVERIEVCRSALEHGEALQVELGPRGYSGKMRVGIRPDDLAMFQSDWEGREYTRSPARLRAAATALRDCRCYGAFDLSHYDGVLLIQRVGGR